MCPKPTSQNRRSNRKLLIRVVDRFAGRKGPIGWSLTELQTGAVSWSNLMLVYRENEQYFEQYLMLKVDTIVKKPFLY